MKIKNLIRIINIHKKQIKIKINIKSKLMLIFYLLNIRNYINIIIIKYIG